MQHSSVEEAKRGLKSRWGAMGRTWAIPKGNLAALALVGALGSAPAAPAAAQEAVSYTHLTLPTNREV